MTESHRVARIERELYQLVSEFLQYQMPEVLPAFVSVTATEVSPDLKHGRVYFRLVGDKETCAETEAALSEYRKDFQNHVAKNLKTKFCPVLKFLFGRVDQLDPVDEMLMNLKKGRKS
ncbi:MAG TPA: hypothetical protein DCL41_04155 [Bdellovibrionales bacterium]|mgnify:CR=1 FL=1|nr:hypothetical protein [Pseudobdellovibrionaceae bacterium]HAG91037.1 hypothetical protein [Bdellovibrionales bacterium]|tara:strand:- start:2131 stop:2484 length:354 start_codon:yes stop_codon:yes gene_type:complete